MPKKAAPDHAPDEWPDGKDFGVVALGRNFWKTSLVSSVTVCVVIAEPTSWTYPADSPTDFAFVQYEIRLRYRYELLPRSPLNLKAGGGLTVLDTRVEMVNFSTDQSSTASDTALSPILHVHVSYDVLRTVRLIAEIDGGWAGKNTYFADAALLVRWTFDPRWHLSGGYRFYGQEFNESDLFNLLQLHRLVLGLAYMW